MTKNYSKIIPIDLYCRDILFIFGDKVYLQKSIRKYHTQEQTDELMKVFDNVDEHTQGRTVLNFCNNAFIVWQPHLPQSVFDMQFLVHEIFHATKALLENAGISLSDESEEAYAYLIGYITKKVLESFPIYKFDKLT